MKLRIRYALLVSLLALSEIHAQRPLVPLMPPRDNANVSAPYTVASPRVTVRRERPTSQLGFDLGMTGRDADTGSDFMGFQVLWGGRVTSKFEIIDDLSLKPSLGYFRRSESVAIAKVVQNQIEFGLNASYVLYRARGFRWNGVLANRFDISFSSLSMSGASQDTPAVLRYRLGPGTGVGIDMGSRIELCIDLEYTFGITSPQRNFSAFTTGLLFPL